MRGLEGAYNVKLNIVKFAFVIAIHNPKQSQCVERLLFLANKYFKWRLK